MDKGTVTPLPISPSQDSLPLTFARATDERLLLRALHHATGQADPFMVTIRSHYPGDFERLLRQVVADIEPSRSNLGVIAEQCEHRIAALDRHLAERGLADPLAEIAAMAADVLGCDKVWRLMFLLGLQAQRSPILLRALDAAGTDDLDAAIAMLSYVIEQPTGDIEAAVLRFDRNRNPDEESIHELRIPPSELVRLMWAH